MYPSNRASLKPRQSFVPRLERLEYRDCPSQAPVIQNLTVTEQAPHMFTITGQVEDDAPEGVMVQFSGVINMTAVTDASGHFSMWVQAMEMGEFEAVAFDLEGLSSAPVEDGLFSNAPVIYDFGATCVGFDVWTFSGRVSDECPAGLVVRLGGIPSLQDKMAIVNQDGTFSITVYLRPGEQGTATAQTTDWWCQESSIASYFVDPSI